MPRVDLVCGGFPCQPFSCAGKQRGAADDRYLWPEVVRCLSAIRPTWFLGENVPGLLHLGIEQVLSDLEAIGYQTQILGIPACAVDAPHIRQRLWIVGWNSDNRRCSGHDWQKREIQEQDGKYFGSSNYLADATSQRCREERTNSERSKERIASGSTVADHDGEYSQEHQRWNQFSETRGKEVFGWRHSDERRIWPIEPSVGRVAHGVSHRVDRLRGLGNAIVPQIAEALGRMILQAHQEVVAP